MMLKKQGPGKTNRQGDKYVIAPPLNGITHQNI